MDEKAELPAEHPTDLLEPVISSIEGGIDDTEITAVNTNIETNAEAGTVDDIGTNEEAETIEEPRTIEESGTIEDVEAIEDVGTNEDAAAVEETETVENISGAVEESEPNVESTDTGNDANTLLSELNDVSLSASANTETDSFLESLTAQNAPANVQPPISDDQIAPNPSDPADVSTDMSMPSISLSEDPEPTPPLQDNAEQEKQEEVTEAPKDEEKVDKEQKDPVCSLEEELQRMHEEDPVNLERTEIKPEGITGQEDQRLSIEDDKEKTQAPIMRDSDLEEMLAADEVLQDPVIIKRSQEDLKQTDVLVCGKCHEAFTFIEEFKGHKSKFCTQKSTLLPTCNSEEKPQVWAYTLWKNKQEQLQSDKDKCPTQWELYKQWCGLSENDKDTWISAGQTLQFCHKLGTAKLTEIKVHKVPKDDEKDPLALDGFDSNKENSSFDNSKSPLLEVKRTVINKPKPVPQIQKVNSDPNSNRAMRTVQSKEKSEYAVERIVAKRFNPKKKTWEYQIKWEHFSSEDNTWEPLSNLNHCKQMVDEFEEQLKKLKAEKAKQQAMALAAKNSPKIKSVQSLNSPASSSSKPLIGTPGIRPQRTSKQRALDQVKAWCGNISDEESSTGVKRARTPDSDDSFEKRLKYEDSEDSETEAPKPKIQFRKIAPKPSPATNSPIQVIKNGIGKNTPLPQNILIPDANGVVRINQKQLPSLSTGVYIMSKTAGIIKLDSNTSKVATSGGQTIVKVAPKIGSTHIKVMKKDGTSTQQIVQVSPKNVQTPQKAMKTHLARAKKMITELKPGNQVIKKTPEVVKKTPIVSKSDSEKKQVIKKIPELQPKPPTKVIGTPKPKEQSTSETRKDDDSDDGLEELPFPDEIKIPEPEDEEDTEFILDPLTGKIAGMEYPEPEPEPEPVEEEKSDSSLDNIVKLAAADITEEDLKNEPQDSMDVEMHGVLDPDDESKIIKTEHHPLPERKFATASPMKPVVKMSVTPRKVAANPTSILNKALTGPQVVRRTVVTPSQRTPQRILNQSVAARNSQLISPVVRQVSTYIRTKPVAPKPRFNIASEVPKFIRPSHQNSSPKNVYSYSRPIVQNSPASRKIGNTTIRSSSMPIVNSQPRTQTKIVRTSSGVVQRIVSPAKKEPVIIRGQPERIERKIVQKPKTVISMPSLMSDDELLLTTKSVPQKMKSMTSTMHTIVQEPQEPEDMEEEPAPMISKPPVSQTTMIAPQEDVTAATDSSAVATLAPDMSSFTLADNENPIFITGDDGTVYQVAGQNEQGQTILLTQGSDGQQQCLLVTNEVAEAMETSPTEEPQAQAEISMPEISPDVTEPLSVKTDAVETNDQVVAQVVRAEPPSPGGTHKVVVMLPDGNLMVTQVSPEEFASLELE